MDGITDSMDMSLSKFQGMVKDREVWHAPVPQRVGTNQVTKHFTEYSAVTGYKINTQKSLAFLNTNNEVSEREVKETILLQFQPK